MTKREKMIDKVKKLLRLSESDNQAEAELAMSRANDIIRNFQLSEDEIADSGDQYQFGTEPYVFPDLRMKYRWTYDMIVAAATLFDCKVVDLRTLHKSAFLIVGPKGNFPAVSAMADYLFNSWKAIVKRDLATDKRRMWQEHGLSFQPKHTMKYKLAHGQKFSSEVRHRAAEIARKRKEVVVQAQGSGRALILASEADIQDYMNKHTRQFKIKQSQGLAIGAEAGARAGKEIPLGGGIDKSTLRIAGK